MVILQTLLGLVVVYLIICMFMSSQSFSQVRLGKGFENFTLVLGDILIMVIVACIILYLAYVFGNIITQLIFK